MATCIEPSEVSFKEKQKLFQDKQNSTEAQNASIPKISCESSVPYSAGSKDKEEEFRRPSVRERIKMFQSSPSSTGATTAPSTNSIEFSVQGRSVESVNTSQGTLLADRCRSAGGSSSTGQSRSISSSAGPTGQSRPISSSAGPTGQSRTVSSSASPTGRSSSPPSTTDQPALPRCVTVSSGQSRFQTRVSDFSQNDKSSEHSSISMADDNRTDAEKLEEVVKESEGLRGELERLTIEHTIKEQELEAHTKQVQELKATNDELKEVVRAAAADVPVSPVGVQQGEGTGKMLKQMRARYLEQVTKTLEDQEKHEKELEDLVQQHKREKQEWRLQEKEPPDDVGPRVHIGQLQQALKSKEEKIEELNVQVRFSQEIASQHKKLKSKSKAQSTAVMNLRRELEETQKAKNDIEGERDILRNEISAEKKNNDSLKKQLAQSQNNTAAELVIIDTVETKAEEVDDLNKQIESLKKELDTSRIQAQQYEEDFKEERRAREQELSEKLAQTQEAAKEEREEKQTVITKLERQSDQVNKDYQHALKIKNDEVGKIVDENARLMAQMEHFRNLSQKLDQHVQTVQVEATRLSNEVVTKTQQVKEYEQQTDSYKVRLEESQRKLQSQVESSRQKQAIINDQWQRTLRLVDEKLKQAEAHLQLRQPVSPVYDERALDPYVVRPRRQIKFDNCKKIGEGCYGSVYAINLDGTPCIAKRLQDILMGRNREEAVSQETKENFHQKFFRECVLLSQTDHPNIIKFIGVLRSKDKYDLTLILEQLSTDLQKFLTRGANISLSTKVSILRDVSCGLLYLHERSIIHRDLTAGNVLLTVDVQAKIADLGVSKIFDRSVLELSKLPGTLGYMPPEALKDKPVYNESIDIFSFGVLALYVAIQEFPEFSHARVPEAIHVEGEGEIYKRRSWIDKMNTKQPELSSLVLWCLQDDPMKRPSTFCLNILLNEMRRELMQ